MKRAYAWLAVGCLVLGTSALRAQDGQVVTVAPPPSSEDMAEDQPISDPAQAAPTPAPLPTPAADYAQPQYQTAPDAAPNPMPSVQATYPPWMAGQHSCCAAKQKTCCEKFCDFFSYRPEQQAACGCGLCHAPPPSCYPPLWVYFTWPQSGGDVPEIQEREPKQKKQHCLMNKLMLWKKTSDCDE